MFRYLCLPLDIRTPVRRRDGDLALIAGLGGTTGSASDLRSEGRGFDSR